MFPLIIHLAKDLIHHTSQNYTTRNFAVARSGCIDRILSDGLIIFQNIGPYLYSRHYILNNHIFIADGNGS